VVSFRSFLLSPEAWECRGALSAGIYCAFTISWSIDKNAGSQTTVVIVDDDENFRLALKMMLELERFDVVGEASDGFEAVDVTVKVQPAFVIIDTMLPGRDGEQAATLIREKAPGSVIVASSGALRATPSWADAFADKTDAAEIPQLLKRLEAAH
jgi:CheY-like chemotaxis protein